MPWSPCACMRTEQGFVSAVPVWCSADSPSAEWRGLRVCKRLVPMDWDDDWTTVCVAPAMCVRYAVSTYT